MLRLDMHMIAGVLQYVAVASFAEAWIENKLAQDAINFSGSPPSRRRGLKILSKVLRMFATSSPPSRRRGLKKIQHLAHRLSLRVASFAEAWIEKKELQDIRIAADGRLLRGGVD